MKILLLMLLFIFPLREVVDVQLAIPTPRSDIFSDYSNENFSQKIFKTNDDSTLTVYIKSSSFYGLNMNFRLFPDKKYIANLPPELRKGVMVLLEGSVDFKTYLENISFFLEAEITYTRDPVSQDAESVFRDRKANCVGYANLVTVFLQAGGIDHKTVKGFYLEKVNKKNMGNTPTKNRVGQGTLIPVPHRWLEIFLPNGTKFFYDPQYQNFSANYIATKSSTDFKEIKRFKVIIIKKTKKIISE